MNPYQWRIDKIKEELRILESQDIKETPTSVTITMRPVCECGHVFTELSESYFECKPAMFSCSSTGHLEQARSFPAWDGFHPSCCPACEKPIERVIMSDMKLNELVRKFTV